MREWLRLLENKGVDVLALEENIQGWSVKNLIDKVKNTLKSNRDEDFSHEVMEAMQGNEAYNIAHQGTRNYDVMRLHQNYCNAEQLVTYALGAAKGPEEGLAYATEKLDELTKKAPLLYIDPETGQPWLQRCAARTGDARHSHESDAAAVPAVISR